MDVNIHWWIVLFAGIGIYLYFAKRRWVLVQICGWFFVFVTTFLTAGLTAKLVVAELPIRHAVAAELPQFQTNSLPVKASVATVSAAEPKKDVPSDDNSKDAIANTMTALGIVLAAITLILALGTTWFAEQLKTFEKNSDDLKKLSSDMNTQLKNNQDKFEHILAENRNRTKQQEALWVSKTKAESELYNAKASLRHWVENNAQSSDRWAIYASLGTWLETLMSNNSLLRLEAFSQLITFLPKMSDELLASVEHYTNTCHEMHGGRNDSVGIWCKIFSMTERAHFLESQKPADGVFY